MLVKIAIALFLLVILYSLGTALYYLVRECSDADSNRVMKALFWRIALSLSLFIALFLVYALGWIKPHGL